MQQTIRLINQNDEDDERGVQSSSITVNWENPFTQDLSDIEPDDWSQVQLDGINQPDWNPNNRRSSECFMSDELAIQDSCTSFTVRVTSWNPVGEGGSDSLIVHVPGACNVPPIISEGGGNFSVCWPLFNKTSSLSLAVNTDSGEEVFTRDNFDFDGNKLSFTIGNPTNGTLNASISYEIDPTSISCDVLNNLTRLPEITTTLEITPSISETTDDVNSASLPSLETLTAMMLSL